MIVAGDSLEEMWLSSLKEFGATTDLHRFDSQRGACAEIENAQLKCVRPWLNRQSSAAQGVTAIFQPLVSGHLEAFRGTAGKDSIIQNRLYHWPLREAREEASGAPPIQEFNQVAHIVASLTRSSEARFHIASLWDPEIDPRLGSPVSPLLLHFKVRDERLRCLSVIRSVDAWMGALPMFEGIAALQSLVGAEVGIGVSELTFLVLSYHVYEMDLPILARTIEL